MRAIIMAVLLAFFVSANASLAAEEPRNQEVTAGIALIKAGDFRKAVQLLRVEVEKTPDDAEANFYLGVALNRLSEKEAETVLKRSLMQTPENPYVNFELGLYYFSKDIDAEAGDYFENVLTLAPEGAYAAQAREYLKRIEEKGREKRWEINFLAGMQFDSNVIVIGDSPLPVGVSRKSDWTGALNFRGNYSLLKEADLELTAGYSFYQTLHAELDDFDVTQNAVDLSLLYGLSSNVKVKVAYSFEHLLLGGHQYDYAHVVAPSLICNFEQWGSTTLDYKFRTTSYKNFGAFTTNTDRNGDNHYIGLTHMVPVGKSYSVWGGYSHDEDLTRVGFFDYHGNRVAAGFRASLPFSSLADLSGEYYRKRYEAGDPALQPAIREDSQYMASLTLMKALSPTFSLMAIEQYTRNVSNIASFDYVRSVTSLFINARF
jgi:tetratricopeptide (TPR) repeat protein